MGKPMAYRSAVFLLVLGLAQMAGDLVAVPALRGLGAATSASPAPKVFTAVHGLEPFSARFVVEWRDNTGVEHSVILTPEKYARLRGPYNRRNVYGAAVAGGPLLQSDPRLRPMWEAVSTYALCGEAPVLRELGVDPATVAGAVRVRLEPRSGMQNTKLPTSLELSCR